MRKLLLILGLMTTCSLTAYAAKYKINTHGQVTAPSGNVQQGSVLNNNYNTTPVNIYNNYSASYYTSSQQALAGQISTIDIVMDFSGSMLFWISAAKQTMDQILAQLPAETNIGFRVFGQDGGNNPYNPLLGKVTNIIKNKKGQYKVSTKQNAAYDFIGRNTGACGATTSVAPVLPYNTKNILSGINTVTIGGSTPLTYGLYQAVNEDFGRLPTTYAKKIILITDGGENCGGDPCAFARDLMAKRRDIKIDVVLVSSSSTELKCLANTTGGKVYTTNDVEGFSNVLINSMKNTPQHTPVQTVPPTTQPKQEYEFIN